MTEREVGRARDNRISRERKLELEKLGRLYLNEAAEYLEMRPKTLYNLLSLDRKEPGSAPKGMKTRNGWEFTIADLKAWNLNH